MSQIIPAPGRPVNPFIDDLDRIDQDSVPNVGHRPDPNAR